MKKVTTSIALVFLLTAAGFGSQTVFADNAEARPWQNFFSGNDRLSFHVDPLEYVTLKNGIRVYLKENPMVPKAAVEIFIEGGTFEESADTLGLTSLWGNSVTFSGSASYPREKLASYLESRAASFSFESSLERSSFSLHTLSPYLAEDWSVVWSVLQQPRFAPEDVALLQSMSVQQIRRRSEKPSSMAYHGASYILWRDNVRSRMATVATVTALTPEHMRQWHKKVLQAERISVLVSGDFDRERLIDAFEKSLGTLTKGETAPEALLEVKTAPAVERLLYLQEKNIPQTTLIWRAPGLEHRSKDYYALKLYDFILGGSSFNSYLTGEIRTKRGWAYAAYSHYSSGAYTGDLTIFIQTQNETALGVIRVMREILAHPENFLSEERLAAAKLSLENRFVFLFETPEKLAELQLSLGWDKLPPDYLNDFLGEINKVTLDDLYRIAKTWYHPDRFFISAVGPVEAFPVDELRAAGFDRIEKFELPIE